MNLIRSLGSMLRRAWPTLRFLIGIAVVVLVFWVLSSHRDELSGFSKVIENLRWWWIAMALVCEAASFVSFAGLQNEFLTVGGLTTPKVPLLEMTVAGQAIADSLPGGNAVTAVYQFRWYRRFGADDTLAAWSLLGTTVATTVTLAFVATAGLGLAASEGASLDLIPVIIGVFLVTVGVGALFIYERPLAIVVRWAIGVSRRLVGRPREAMEAQILRSVDWVTSIRLRPRQIIDIVLWGKCRWLFDSACFAMMFLAVGAPVPWKGLLLAYGAGQLARCCPSRRADWAWLRAASPLRSWPLVATRAPRSMRC